MKKFLKFFKKNLVTTIMVILILSWLLPSSNQGDFSKEIPWIITVISILGIIFMVTIFRKKFSKAWEFLWEWTIRLAIILVSIFLIMKIISFEKKENNAPVVTTPPTRVVKTAKIVFIDQRVLLPNKIDKYKISWDIIDSFVIRGHKEVLNVNGSIVPPDGSGLIQPTNILKTKTVSGKQDTVEYVGYKFKKKLLSL